jgi:hypothetical protein
MPLLSSISVYLDKLWDSGSTALVESNNKLLGVNPKDTVKQDNNSYSLLSK